MRLFLLPISTRSSLIYCARIADKKPGGKPSLIDRLTNKANATWANWEKAESGWKKQLTTYGEKAFRRIPYQEWGLKSLPPLTEARKMSLVEGKTKVEALFPASFLKEDRVEGVLRDLATERQGLHKQRLWWSILAMPFSAPFMLIPIVPNIPFFYLVFRAWSHWRALSGASHLQFLLEKNLITRSPSAALDEMYAAGLIHPTREQSREAQVPTMEQIESVAHNIETQAKNGSNDVMVLQRWNGKLLAERFEMPEMEVEIERAVEQVQKALDTDTSSRKDTKSSEVPTKDQ